MPAPFCVFEFCVLHYSDPVVDIQLDIWLRGDNHATTEAIAPVERAPGAWTEGDVAAVLAGMLRALDRAKNPDADQTRPVALRGFSWIVNPFETGGVVIALEMSLGAVVAGPFDISESDLNSLIERAMSADRVVMAGQSRTVH